MSGCLWALTKTLVIGRSIYKGDLHCKLLIRWIKRSSTYIVSYLLVFLCLSWEAWEGEDLTVDDMFYNRIFWDSTLVRVSEVISVVRLQSNASSGFKLRHDDSPEMFFSPSTSVTERDERWRHRDDKRALLFFTKPAHLYGNRKA